MCRLYGFRANEPTKVGCTLVHAQNALMVQSREDLAGYSHGHGWGIAVYVDHNLIVERQAWSAYHGEHFRHAAARAYSQTVLAHVRRATVGPATIQNTHPFTFADWAFIHNGTVPNFDALRSRLLDEMSAEHRAAILGDTDSEHVFHFLLSRHERDQGDGIFETVRAGISDIVSWCRSLDPDEDIGLNMMLSDGERLVGTRCGRSLFYVERDGVYDCEICGFPHIHHNPTYGAHRAVEVASEPITHENWREMPEDSVFELGPGMALRIENL